MARMCGKLLTYLRNGFTMLEMAYEFHKRLKYMGHYVYMLKWLKCLRKVFEKNQKYVGNDVDMWEITKIWVKWLQ